MKRKDTNADPKSAELQNTTRVSFILILASLGTYLVVALISLYFHDWSTVSTICGGSVTLAVPFWLLRRGHFRAGNMILMIIVLATVTTLATVGQGIHDLAIVAYPIVFIYVGLTSDRAMLGVCGGLTFLAILWLAFGEPFGWFAPVPLFRDPLNLFYLSVLAILFVVTALAVDLLSSNMRKTIELARHEIGERRKAEHALRDSNDLFSQFLLHSPVYAYIKEVTPEKSRVVQASENFVNMVGIPGHEMIGKTMEELFPADFAARMTADDWSVVSGGSVLQLDEELNGRHYTTIKFPISREGEKFLAGYTIDITERKQAEDVLRASEERFRKLFKDHSAINLIIDGETGTIVDANDAAVRFYGWPIDELRRMRIQQINTLPPEVVKGEMDMASSSKKGKFEFRHRRADGSIREVEVFSSNIEVGGKAVLYSVIHDITERKRAEAMLRQGEERYRLMFESAPLAITITRGTDIIYANPSYLRLFGLSSLDELKRCPPLDQFAPASAWPRSTRPRFIS